MEDSVNYEEIADRRLSLLKQFAAWNDRWSELRKRGNTEGWTKAAVEARLALFKDGEKIALDIDAEVAGSL